MINPHGGKLINRVVSEKKREKILSEYKELPQLTITDETSEDLNNISHGVFSPLTGFMGEEDIDSIIKNDRLANGLPWTIPITLDIAKEAATKYSIGEEIVLINGDQVLGVLQLKEIFPNKKKEIAQSVFQTLDMEHPGVANVMNSKDTLLAGDIELINTDVKQYNEYTFYPKETREIFKKKNWKTVVGFQTRNVPHLGHEYVQKAALTLVDGLFVNPIIGKKKKDDFLDPVILGAYNILLEHYYPKEKATMGILRTRMRYGGPKEAIFHSIMRKNFGCSHFIVGRDHAGVGSYYGPFDAHSIFEKFDDLEIQPICFRSFYICEKCTGIVSDNVCPHDGSEFQKFISGKKIRAMIMNKELEHLGEFMRPEVAKYLIEQDKLFVE